MPRANPLLGPAAGQRDEEPSSQPEADTGASTVAAKAKAEVSDAASEGVASRGRSSTRAVRAPRSKTGRLEGGAKPKASAPVDEAETKSAPDETGTPVPDVEAVAASLLRQYGVDPERRRIERPALDLMPVRVPRAVRDMVRVAAQRGGMTQQEWILRAVVAYLAGTEPALLGDADTI